MQHRAPIRELRDWTSDSRRWANFVPRPGDVVVATAPKCGTTWTQRIIGMLLRQSAVPVAAADFAAMKRDGAALLPTAGIIWEGGSDRFLNKGTNQRWRDVVTADDLARYEAEASKGMSARLKAWAEAGRLVAGDPMMAGD